MTGIETALLGASLAGAALGAVGQIQQGQAAAAVAQRNAQIARLDATRAREAAAEKARQSERQSRRLLGTVRARTLASGIMFEGSALEHYADTAAEAELERLTILYSGEVAGTRYDNEAAYQSTRASTLKRAGFLSGAATLVGGLGRAYSVLGPVTGASASSRFLSTPVPYGEGQAG